MYEWIEAKYEVPPETEEVLVIATLKPVGETEVDQYALAFYTRQGWILEDMDQDHLVCVRFWTALPEIEEITQEPTDGYDYDEEFPKIVCCYPETKEEDL